MAKKEEKGTTETWVYMGRVESSKRKIFHEYAPVEDGEVKEEDGGWYGKKLVRGIGVGSLIEVQVVRDGDNCTVLGDGRKYIGPSNLDQVEEWIVRDASVADAQKMRGKVKRDLEDASMNELLRPVREVYWRTAPMNRAALIGRVIYEITKGRI